MVLKAELWLPESLASASTLIGVSGPDAAFRSEPDHMNASLSHVDPHNSVWRLENDYRVLDMSQLFPSERPPARLHLSIDVSLGEPLCGRKGKGEEGGREEHEEVPFLSLSIRETRRSRSRSRSKSGHSKRNVAAAAEQHLIIDCERQWDRAHLNSSPLRIQEEVLPCCRRQVSIDFGQIGWGHWVLAPASFQSYYCLGRCKRYGGFAVDSNEGASFYAEIMNHQNTGRAMHLVPCCSPVKFAPLTITTLAGDSEEMTQTLKDVIIERCGCM